MRGWLVASVSCALYACGGEPAAPPPAAPMAIPSAKPAPCTDDEQPLTAAPTGAKPDLPPVPDLPDLPKRAGDAFTVYGATHALRSRYEAKDVMKADISIVGWIVDSNVPRAPKCAWHKTGVPDPATCISEIPSFVIADAKVALPDDPKTPHIKVLGWARNFAVVFDASAKYKGLTAPPKQLVTDEVWSVPVPYPLPAAGTKVKVTGRYSFAFSKSSTGLVTDPKNGVLTYTSLEVVP